MELADDAQSGAAIDPVSYVPKTLRSEIERRKRLLVHECIEIGMSLAAALDNLHRHGLIHRDIKPANIIFVKNLPKLADIGLVTDMDVTVSYVGTEGYIPPEGPKSAQADIYALGKVLYEIATGKDRLEFPELPENFSELPDWEILLELNAVIIKACEADPRKRYSSARDFQDDLALISTGKSVRQKRAVRRRTALIMRYCLGIAASCAIAAGIFYFHRWWKSRQETASVATTTSKIPWPAAHDIAEQEAELKDTYAAQIATGASPGRQQAALELLNRSATTGDPAFEAASLRVAGLLAARANDESLLLQICDRMEQRFQIDVFPEKAELLEQVNNHARTARNKSDLAEACLATGFAAIAADDYPSAMRLSELAKNSASGSGDSSLVQLADFLDQETARCSGAYDGVTNSYQLLRSKPTDPQANLAVGKFLCFIKEDWSGGLLLLARDGDAALSAVAKEEIGGKLKDPQEQLALGNSWWNLSSKTSEDDKVFYQRRARYWFLKCIANSKEPDKTRLRQELSERIDDVPVEAGNVHIVSRVTGTEFIDIYSDEVQWKSSRRGTTGNKINQVNLGDFKGGGLEIIENSGATRLMPDTVDFSTAHLAIDHISNRQGQVTLQIADDHVRVVLAHPRLGASEIEVTVSFQKRPNP
jgi:hypothetical protein